MSALGESFWFILVIWVLMLAFYFAYRDVILGTVTGIVGLFFGVTLMPEINWLSYVLFLFNIYILFVALFKETKKR